MHPQAYLKYDEDGIEELDDEDRLNSQSYNKSSASMSYSRYTSGSNLSPSFALASNRLNF